ncbi:MAG: RNA polymerase sigma factor (sigma-70 family) [Sphingobacteriales bacterium]|jgi:RNA polymerase sigma factor (sigma-70 family)
MSTMKISDRELITKYLAGDNTAMEQLVVQHKSKIYTTIYLLVKNEALAEDIFQDTFMKVIKTLQKGKYNEEGKFLPWVLRIAHNLAIDHFRKVARTPYMEHGNDEYDVFDFIKNNEPNAEQIMMRDQSHANLKKLVDQLPREQKEVLVMRHYAELSFKEIADITNVSINTALGRMRYALNNLRKIAEEKKVSL